MGYPERTVPCSGGCGKTLTTKARKPDRYCPECMKIRAKTDERYLASRAAIEARRAAKYRAEKGETTQSLGGSLLVVYDQVDPEVYEKTVTINGKEYTCKGAAGGAILSWWEFERYERTNFVGCKLVDVFTNQEIIPEQPIDRRRKVKA